MKQGCLFFLSCIFLYISGYAQTVSFSQLPVDGQLYPRTPQSVGVIPISGRISGAGIAWLSAVVTRNGSLFQYQQFPVFYTTPNTATFSTTLTIPAQLAQFRVRIFQHRSLIDSVLVADRQRIVAGDAYVINGQSNAAAYYSSPEYN